MNKQGTPALCDRGNPDQLTTKNKENKMNTNILTVSGSIKAFSEKSLSTNDYGTQLTGWINQREESNGKSRYIVGVGFKATNPKVIAELVALDKARQGQAGTSDVTLTGRLTQWVAKSKTGGADEFRYQLEVTEINPALVPMTTPAPVAVPTSRLGKWFAKN